MKKQGNGRKVLLITAFLTIGVSFRCTAAGRPAILITNKVSDGAIIVKSLKIVTGKITQLGVRKNIHLILVANKLVRSFLALDLAGEFLVKYVIIRVTKSQKLAETFQRGD